MTGERMPPHHPPSRRHRAQLPAHAFGCLVGTLGHITETPGDDRGAEREPDDNHLYLWVRVSRGPYSGVYECAVNIASDRDGSRSEYLVRDERWDDATLPLQGFWAASLSYRGMGLTHGHFQPIQSEAFQHTLITRAEACQRICIYGVVYGQGNGLHDIHLNTPTSTRQHAATAFPNYGHGRDGALAFYQEMPGVGYLRRWVFIKFAGQEL